MNLVWCFNMCVPRELFVIIAKLRMQGGKEKMIHVSLPVCVAVSTAPGPLSKLFGSNKYMFPALCVFNQSKLGN